jgi:hypothetical protein
MSAATPVRSDHSQDTKRIIAFGGTGKTVALIYRKIGRLLGENANIVICDFPPSGDYNSSDGRLDRDLAEENVGQQCRINTLPDACRPYQTGLSRHSSCLVPSPMLCLQKSNKTLPPPKV